MRSNTALRTSWGKSGRVQKISRRWKVLFSECDHSRLPLQQTGVSPPFSSAFYNESTFRLTPGLVAHFQLGMLCAVCMSDVVDFHVTAQKGYSCVPCIAGSVAALRRPGRGWMGWRRRRQLSDSVTL
ncbi:uncharacterized protein LOC132790767 [Drosophila nasuta]|uniref:uncharacterized protein LOC132790767 n=1 Tax=Drosophila nasuta TaxID=42062 RepID=UPI00295E37A0|nr:uncharacterized protein LOC132790767 [Drosophila nasuta]